jgi:hypothetical protein
VHHAGRHLGLERRALPAKTTTDSMASRGTNSSRCCTASTCRKFWWVGFWNLYFRRIAHAGPGLVSGVREDPAAVILGLDHEDAESRNEDVIYLRRPVVHAKGDVIHQVVVRCAEVPREHLRHQRLTGVLKRREAPRAEAAPSPLLWAAPGGR